MARVEPSDMNVDTIRTEPEPASGAQRVVDVSELRADRIETFADGDAVHLERRGGKTYLVADG